MMKHFKYNFFQFFSIFTLACKLTTVQSEISDKSLCLRTTKSYPN